MAFHYLTNTPLDEAREIFLQTLQKEGFSAGIETIPVSESCGRITARPVYANICSPHYPASAMDGIALNAELTYGAGETTPVTLTEQQFRELDTGDPIPDNCDAVIMIEDVIRQPDGTVRLFAPAIPWQHVRQIGEDICAGEMILPSYTEISPAAIGSMIAGGVLKTDVLKKPVVGIIPTGDEIVPPSENPEPGDILEFNSSIFSAMLRKWNAKPAVYPIVPDDREKIRAVLLKALEECDMVLLNAGSSAGRDDYSTEMIDSIGEILFHGIAIKPVKPAILAHRKHQPILGIPGYPVSGIIVLEQLFRPLIDAWYHQQNNPPATCMATLSKNVVSGLKYREFVRVRLGVAGSRIIASPLNRGSGVVSSFMKADGILEIPQGVEGFEAGSSVPVQLLTDLAALNNTLISTGSHDPLLDELADMLHATDTSLFMSSSHVGSMGGIMAVKRGETHIAGTHLLDEADGSYNTSYIRKYFPKGGVRLVECVYRTQGLMLQKGNPKDIQGVRDLVRPGIRYVNRQKGSGTRILIDYLCRQEKIQTDEIYGYDREEFTHTSVATQIASNTADTGMGIYSASKIYDLDFLPICLEQYDLLIPDTAWDTEPVQKLLTILRGDEFRNRIEALGGYELQQPGRVREHF